MLCGQQVKSINLETTIMKKYYRRWLLRAPLGLIFIGFGLSLLPEAALLKYDHAPTLEWVLAGTFALVVFNSGLSIFGSAILNRWRYEQQREQNSGDGV
jgi:hypothetical protein